MDIYNKIRELREQQGMTQEALAKKVGYKSRSTVNKIEKGLRDISQSQVEIFAKALNTTPAYLMGWENEEVDTIAAHHDGEWTDDELEEIEKFKAYVKSKRK